MNELIVLAHGGGLERGGVGLLFLLLLFGLMIAMLARGENHRKD